MGNSAKLHKRVVRPRPSPPRPTLIVRPEKARVVVVDPAKTGGPGPIGAVGPVGQEARWLEVQGEGQRQAGGPCVGRCRLCHVADGGPTEGSRGGQNDHDVMHMYHGQGPSLSLAGSKCSDHSAPAQEHSRLPQRSLSSTSTLFPRRARPCAQSSTSSIPSHRNQARYPPTECWMASASLSNRQSYQMFVSLSRRLLCSSTPVDHPRLCSQVVRSHCSP